MKNKKTFALTLILLLTISLSFTIVSSEEKKEFNHEDIQTWESATNEELASLTSEDIFLHYKGSKETIENLWVKFDEKSKNDFLETECFRETKSGIIFENIGHADLKLKDGKLTNENGAAFDIKNFPKNLKKISYDPQKGFIYEFSDDKKITIDSGGIDSENKVYDSNNPNMNGAEIVSGEIVISDKKINFIDKNSKMIIEGRTFSIGKLEDKPGLIIISASGIYGVNNIKITSSEAIITLADKNTYVIFGKGDYLHSEIGGQFFQIDDKNLIAAGAGSVNLLQSFDEVSVYGSKEEGITVYNGENNDFPIEFKGDKTSIQRTIKEAPHDIDYINNGYDEKKFYTLKTDENGARYLTDHQKTTIAGKAYVSYFGGEQTEENSLLKLPNKATAVIASFELGVDDLASIPEGFTREQYIEYISKSRDKSTEFKLNEINEYMISTGITKTARQMAGEEFFEGLKSIYDTASDYGLVESMDKKAFDTKVDETIKESAYQILGGIDSAVKNSPVITEFRQVTSSMPYVDLMQGILGNEILQYNVPEAATAAETVSAARSALSGVQTYVDFSDAIQKVYSTYDGKIPKGTGIKVVMSGDTAYGIIQVPDGKMKTIKFQINSDTANIIINNAIQTSDRLNGWYKYNKK